MYGFGSAHLGQDGPKKAIAPSCRFAVTMCLHCRILRDKSSYRFEIASSKGLGSRAFVLVLEVIVIVCWSEYGLHFRSDWHSSS